MKPAPFDYARPETLSETVKLLASAGGEGKIIAGGQSLMPMLAFRLAAPKLLVDIGRLRDLTGIQMSPEGIDLGALVRWRDIEDSDEVARAHPLLSDAVRYVAHYQIRNRGTIGGSLAHADPAAELPGIALTCDATIDVVGNRGMRTIAARDFFTGPLTTSLDSDEVIVRLRLPAWKVRRCWAFKEFARRKGDFALAGVALFYDTDAQGKTVAPHFGAIGVSGTPVRLSACEAALTGHDVDAKTVTHVAARAAEGLEIHDDIHAPADYRRALLQTLVDRALRAAAGLKESA
ncbi:MAG TPA: xanthine dehydrogenase family protein subunit M [Pseudolabrys sp.]|nr:xanthine dehydrogenase family protein subunit M [Pseudolabrys sp.]